MKSRVASLRPFRPAGCLYGVYGAAPGSTFASILPLLKAGKVGAYNGASSAGSRKPSILGFVGKDLTAEPLVWFHDIFRRTEIRTITRKWLWSAVDQIASPIEEQI